MSFFRKAADLILQAVRHLSQHTHLREFVIAVVEHVVSVIAETLRAPVVGPVGA